MILLDAALSDKGWTDWALNQVGVAVGAIAVCIVLYKMYSKTLEGKDQAASKERDRLIKELDAAKQEKLDLARTHAAIISEYQRRIDLLQKELKELAVDSIKSLGSTSTLIEGVILSRLTQDTGKLREMLNMMQTNLSNHLAKIELLLSQKENNNG